MSQEELIRNGDDRARRHAVRMAHRLARHSRKRLASADTPGRFTVLAAQFESDCARLCEALGTLHEGD